MKADFTASAARHDSARVSGESENMLAMLSRTSASSTEGKT